jgi:hypothetical protein
MTSRCNSLGRVSVALLVIIGGVVLASAGRARNPTASDSREALVASFDSDISAMVYQWDPDDSRPEPERRGALRDFMYQAYDSSAWIPQSAFDGNAFLQLVVGDADTIIRDRIGLVPWHANRIARAYGVAPDPAGGGRSVGPSTASPATWPRSTVSPTSAPGERC